MVQGSAHWQQAYDTYICGPRGCKQLLHEKLPRSFKPRDALRLLSSVGCMCCGKLRIRKVRNIPHMGCMDAASLF